MSDEIEKTVADILKGVKADAVYAPGAHLRRDLDLDSLDVMMLLFEVEKAFNVKIPEEALAARELLVLRNLTAYLQEHGNTH